MNKYIKPVFCILSLCFVIASCSGIGTQKGVAQTHANEPAIRKGDIFSYSKTKAPGRFDFICFMGEVPIPDMKGKYLQVYRLCGLPGDTVEIRDGDFYLNNELMDRRFNLKHDYLVAGDEQARLHDLLPADDIYASASAQDSFVVSMDDEFVRSHQVKARRKILPPSDPDSMIALHFPPSWNQDHFGPVTVPPDTYFVLGDNRSQAFDSRYRGFISAKDFAGTVIR